jgi:hypothetical protein
MLAVRAEPQLVYGVFGAAAPTMKSVRVDVFAREDAGVARVERRRVFKPLLNAGRPALIHGVNLIAEPHVARRGHVEHRVLVVRADRRRLERLVRRRRIVSVVIATGRFAPRFLP